ncbi:hypothetical protein LXA43DRAFT_1091437 [Ganoderma leucocontextum]|nr:hypothetical protein LXA43DRAFT_1091437 [Ganoderma leucocontextum]
MSFADHKVVSNLMNTFDTLNSEGARYLLSDGAWTRQNPDNFFRRLSFFSKLTLYPYDPPLEVRWLLADFLEGVASMAFNFTPLHDAEHLLAAYPPLAIGSAIAKLTTLQVLTLFSTGETARRFFTLVIVDILRAFSASTFKLILGWTLVWTDAGRDGEAPPVIPFEIYLQNVNVDAYADILFTSVASLEE